MYHYENFQRLWEGRLCAEKPRAQPQMMHLCQFSNPKQRAG